MNWHAMRIERQMIWVALIGLLPFGGHLYAQPIALRSLPSTMPIPARPNQLDFPLGTKQFDAVWQKMDTLIFKGKGHVNMVHVGGSHVQAGLLTDAIRYRLQSMAPGLSGERGFFFPYKVAHTNNPASYRVSYTGEWTGQRCSVPYHNGPWGVSGIRAWTIDSLATVHVHGREEALAFNHLRVFSAPSDSSYAVNILGDPDTSWYNASLQAYEARWETLQDSIEFALQSSDSTHWFSLEGLQVLRDDIGIRYHAIGTNGAATHSYLKCERFVDQLHAFPPDLVIWGLGINDAYKQIGRFDTVAYEQHYDSLVAWVQKVNPHAAFIWVTNNDSKYKGNYNPHGEMVQRVMRRLARKHGGAVHDFYHMMGGSRSINFWIRKGWAKKDGIHMTHAGYAIQAAWLAEAIEWSYLNHFKS